MFDKLKIDELQKYFQQRKDIAFAYLFGSFSKNNAGKNSDVDIAGYFYPPKKYPVEFEEEIFYKAEDEIIGDHEKKIGKEVELLVINRAPSVISSIALRGKPLATNDYGYFGDCFNIITSADDDFRGFYLKNYFDKINERRDKISN